jgi:uncharacterized protein (TIGR03663 family)
MIPLKRYLGKDNSTLLLLILVIAALLRVLFLDIKPTHFDEGVNGWFVEQIKFNGVFDYSPDNFHGPLYFYLLWIFDVLFGSSIVVHRFVAAICSLSAIYVFYKSLEVWGARKWWGLWALALSPALVFYARYSIHESLLLFGFSLWLYGCLHLLRLGTTKSIWLLTSGFLVMALTKETFLIFTLNTFIALGLVKVWQKKTLWNSKLDVTYPILISTLVILLFYSEFFTSLKETKEFFTAFAIWKDTGFKHTGHEKPFYYWLGLLWRYEWIFLVGFLLSLKEFFSKDKIRQFVAIYGFGNLLAFSLISYKTPWCLLTLLFPYAYFLQPTKKWHQISISLLLVAGAAESIRLNFISYVNPKESYVYVQTTTKMKVVTDALRNWLKQHPEDHNIPFLVITDTEWPLPWLLKDYSAISYEHALTEKWKDYDLIIMDADTYLGLQTESFVAKDFQIRYEQKPSVFLIHKNRPDLIDAFQHIPNFGSTP